MKAVWVNGRVHCNGLSISTSGHKISCVLVARITFLEGRGGVCLLVCLSSLPKSSLICPEIQSLFLFKAGRSWLLTRCSALTRSQTWPCPAGHLVLMPSIRALIISHSVIRDNKGLQCRPGDLIGFRIHICFYTFSWYNVFKLVYSGIYLKFLADCWRSDSFWVAFPNTDLKARDRNGGRALSGFIFTTDPVYFNSSKMVHCLIFFLRKKEEYHFHNCRFRFHRN